MKLDPQKQRFRYRVTGVVIHEAKVLCHRDEKEDYWVLPGGASRFGEISVDTLTREFREELNAHISIGRLLWVVENFYLLRGLNFHQIDFVYEVTLKTESKNLTRRDQFLGFEVNPNLPEDDPVYSLPFRWIPLTSLSTFDLRPSLLKTELLSLPPVTKQLIHHDRRP